MKLVLFLCAALFLISCSHMSAATSSRKPSSFGYDAESRLVIFNSNTNKFVSTEFYITQIALDVSGLQLTGPVNGAEPRSCVISRSLAEKRGVTLGDLALLIRQGTKITCSIQGSGDSTMIYATDFSFSNQFVQ